MGYKCEDEVWYYGRMVRTGHCETCNFEHVDKFDEPCRECIHGTSKCPMYSHYTGPEQCAGCKWEAKE